MSARDPVAELSPPSGGGASPLARQRLLVLEPDRATARAIQSWLSAAGYGVELVFDEHERLRRFERETFDLILLGLPGGGAADLSTLDAVVSTSPAVPVIVLAESADLEVAIDVMRRGGYDYVVRSNRPEPLLDVVRRALEESGIARGPARPDAPRPIAVDDPRQVGRSEPMVSLSKRIGRVAPTDISVLIRGESGVGKELVARAIHRHSPRAAGPFIAVSCAALPETLLESELFGYERGAFTGAVARHRGRFEQADGGTLFLDEVGDLSPVTQVKLLRAIQEQAFERVGGNELIEVDVRIVAATHCDLEDLVRGGRFREDLYYRLAVFTIQVPPLRERIEDVPVLAAHFLRDVATRVGRPRLELSASALARLMQHEWPGNVRELEHCLQQAAVLCKGSVIDSDSLQLRSAGPVAQARPDELCTLARRWILEAPGSVHSVAVDHVECIVIREAVRSSRGNLSAAARLLGISRPTLRQRIAHHRLNESARAD